MASHLSEFYSIVNTNSPQNDKTDDTAELSINNNVDSSSRTQSVLSNTASLVGDGLTKLLRRPSLASTSTSFTNQEISSSFPSHELPALITSKELANTLNSYNHLLDASVKYRHALLAVSYAAAEFGSALEECSDVKGLVIRLMGYYKQVVYII